MSKIYVIKIEFYSQIPSWEQYNAIYPYKNLLSIGAILPRGADKLSQEGDVEITEVLADTLGWIHDNLPVKSNYENFYDNRGSIYREYGLDYTKITEIAKTGESESQQIKKIVDTFKSFIKEIFESSSVSSGTRNLPIKDTPPKVDYKITVDEESSTVNTFSGESNAGGWELVYELTKVTPPESATQSGVTASNALGEKVEVVSPQAPTQSDVLAATQSTPPPSQLGSTQSVTNPETGVVDQEKSRGEIPGQEQNSSNEQTQKTSPSPKSIIQIVEPKLKGAIMKFDVTDEKSVKKDVVENLGNIPIIYYNSYQIDFKDIDFFQLYTGGNLPTIKLVFKDTLSLMKDKAFPLDDTKITIFINSRSEQLKNIHMDFKIIKFSASGQTYTLTATIDANQLYIKKFKSFSQKTSFQTLKSLSEEVGLGFASNLDDTNDSMTWINPGQKYYEFIDTVVSNSYKSDETYLTSYIDFFYNLTYVDIEKELRRNIREELGVGNMGLNEIYKKTPDVVNKIGLTNDMGFKTSNIYFKEYRIINKSTSISLREGYFTKVKFYDQLKKDFLIFNLEAITSDEDDKIILKGQPQDENFFKENTELIYLGKLDEDNMYNNYHYSSIQNYRNLVELEKIGLEVTMKTPNYNFYKYQKVILAVSNQSPTPTNNPINARLSGEWLIVDIMYRFENKNYNQIIKLVKRELELSPEEKKRESNQNKTKKDSSRGTNSNPDTSEQPNYDRQEAKSIANNQTPDTGASDSTQATDEPANTFVPDTRPSKTPLLLEIPYQGTKYYYLANAQDGIAGKRLRQFQKDLEAYLNKNGFSGTKLKSNGIMRDLVAAGNPQKIPARASGSLHGAGLAHDLQFAVPGIKWAGIGDNKNLAANKELTATIWKFVQAQKDITWGAEWGRSVNLSKGETNGHGITEYHHFEIKSNFIAQYWAPYDAEIKKLGYDYKKLVSTKACAPFYISVLNGRV